MSKLKLNIMALCGLGLIWNTIILLISIIIWDRQLFIITLLFMFIWVILTNLVYYSKIGGK